MSLSHAFEQCDIRYEVFDTVRLPTFRLQCKLSHENAYYLSVTVDLCPDLQDGSLTSSSRPEEDLHRVHGRDVGRSIYFAEATVKSHAYIHTKDKC